VWDEVIDELHVLVDPEWRRAREVLGGEREKRVSVDEGREPVELLDVGSQALVSCVRKVGVEPAEHRPPADDAHPAPIHHPEPGVLAKRIADRASLLAAAALDLVARWCLAAARAR
jgi:hypothetical protein